MIRGHMDGSIISEAAGTLAALLWLGICLGASFLVASTWTSRGAPQEVAVRESVPSRSLACAPAARGLRTSPRPAG